jgi:hypothetical protein
MLMILARLGLRAPEAIAIQLDDIDWRGGTILPRQGQAARPHATTRGCRGGHRRRFLHQNYSGYLVHTNADIPHVDVAFAGEFDSEASPLGAKGPLGADLGALSFGVWAGLDPECKYASLRPAFDVRLITYMPLCYVLLISCHDIMASCRNRQKSAAPR